MTSHSPVFHQPLKNSSQTAKQLTFIKQLNQEWETSPNLNVALQLSPFGPQNSP